MKVLFLDIDGVLNSTTWLAIRRECGTHDDEPHPQVSRLDPTAVKLLNEIIERTGAKIVVSSTWRMFGLESVNEVLREAGATVQAIDVTPDFGPLIHPEIIDAITAGESMQKILAIAAVRGREIQDWLDRHPEASEVAIVDDDTDMGAKLKPRLVQTSFEHGLRRVEAEKLVALLGGARP